MDPSISSTTVSPEAQKSFVAPVPFSHVYSDDDISAIDLEEDGAPIGVAGWILDI